MTDAVLKKIELAALYEVRLAISESEKEAYQKEEILALLDQIALVKK